VTSDNPFKAPENFKGEYKNAKIALFGAPFDGTTSYRPGTRFAPAAIRGEFYGLELYSPYQDKNIQNVAVFDCGDLTLPFGNTSKVLEIIEEFTDSLNADGKIPFMLGGEHLVTLATVRSLYKKYNSLCIVQIDAHADLMDEYIGEKLSHATVMRRVWELLGDNRIYQIGIRSGKRYEFEFAQAHNYIQRFEFDFSQLGKIADELKDIPVYLSVDLDVLDPSIFPGTGTPEAGGVSFNELLKAIIMLSPLNIVGCDLTELSPGYDPSGISTSVACKVLREMLLILD
jgi:agmatinase